MLGMSSSVRFGVVSGWSVGARPQQRHEAGCQYVWAEL